MTVCYATRERLAAHRRFEELHSKLPYHNGNWGNWAKAQSSDAPYHFLEGSTIWVAATDLGLGGDFLRQHDDEE